MTTVEASSSRRPYSDGKPDTATATADGRGGIESVSVCRLGCLRSDWLKWSLYDRVDAWSEIRSSVQCDSPFPLRSPSYFILPVYYRLYVADGPLESVNPIYSNDHFISRILSKSVAPPHTAASLKRYVCRIEGIEAPEKCTLFLSLLEKIPIGDDTRLSLRAKSGPGLSELEPMALIVDTQACHKRSPAARKPPLERLDETATRYGASSIICNCSKFELTNS